MDFHARIEAQTGQLRLGTQHGPQGDDDPNDDIRSRRATDAEIQALVADEKALESQGLQATYFASVRKALGIVIVDVRIKRADFPPDIESSVFSRMEAERERIASGLRAEGSQRDAEIRAEVDR